MNKVSVQKNHLSPSSQPVFGDWKEIYKPLSNYLKQVIHARNTIGVLIPNIGRVYRDMQPFFSIRDSSPYIITEEKVYGDDKVEQNNKHIRLNELGIYCIISFHCFNRVKSWGSIRVCYTWIHLKSLEVIFRDVLAFGKDLKMSIDDVFRQFKWLRMDFENWKRIKILIGYKVKATAILSLIYSFVPEYTPKGRFGKFMDLDGCGFSLLNQKQIESLWEWN